MLRPPPTVLASGVTSSCPTRSHPCLKLADEARITPQPAALARGAPSSSTRPRPVDARQAAHLPFRAARNGQRRRGGARRRHVAVERAPAAPAPGRDGVRPDMGGGAAAARGAPGRPVRGETAGRAADARASRTRREPVVAVTRDRDLDVAAMPRGCRADVAFVSLRWSIPSLNRRDWRKMPHEPRHSQLTNVDTPHLATLWPPCRARPPCLAARRC